MTRAQETCTEIREVFDNAEVDYEFSGQSDLLREGPPYPTEPPLSKWTHKHAYWEESARIESGFRTFIHRAEPTQEHESNEVIVCHANVIRYFLCRVLRRFFLKKAKFFQVFFDIFVNFCINSP